MDELISQLKQLGFTEYEAKAYIALVQNSHVSAYQVSKDSGIPRARVYDILDLLIEKGLVLKEETPDYTIYSSIPVTVFLQKMQHQWHANFNMMSDQLKELETQELQTEPKVLILKGQQMIMSYCKELLKKAKQKVLLSMWEDMYEALRDAIDETAQRIPVHGITLYVDSPVASVDQHRRTQYTKTVSTPHWFILSIDGQQMIYGHSPANRDMAFLTDDPVHIYLLEDYIWHDVLVNRLVKRREDELGEWITKERKAFFLE